MGNKNNSRQYLISLSLIVTVILSTLILTACGGGGNSNSSQPTEFIYSTTANEKGTFKLISTKSGTTVESSEDNTLKPSSSIVLIERLPNSNESKIFGSNSSNVYTLQGKNDKQTIYNLEKPVIITIPNNFDNKNSKFFLGSKSENDSDWQYIEIYDENNTDTLNLKSARLAVKDLNTFKVKTYRLSYSFAIFASKDNNAAKSDSVKLMNFSVEPSNVYYDEKSKFITDIKVSSCIAANKSSSLFSGATVKSQLVFFNSNSADVKGIKIDNLNAVQSSATIKDTSNNKHSHTLFINNYKADNISINGNIATYTFELNLKGISTKNFPDNFRIKTILKDSNGIEFASEGAIKLNVHKKIEETRTNTSTDTSSSSNTKTEFNTNTESSTSTQTSNETNTNTSTNTNTYSGTSTKTSTTINTDANTGSDTSTQTNIQTFTNTDITINTNTSTNTGTMTTTEISVSIIPANSETTKVEVTTPIKIFFSEKMDKNQNLLNFVTLINNSTSTNLITASNQLEWSTENNKDVLIVKNVKLVPEMSYTIKLNSGLFTENGLSSTNRISSNFVTRDIVTLKVTNPSVKDVAVNSKIEITSSIGSISSINNATISFNSNSKTGSFSIENGKAYFTLTTGTIWNPETTYSGTISGLLDSDGCETKPCNFSFTTRNRVALNVTNPSTQNVPLNTKIEITPISGTISDVSMATITFDSVSKNGTFSIENGKVYYSLTPNTIWDPFTNYSGEIKGFIDNDGCETKACNFNFTTRNASSIIMSEPKTNVILSLDDSLKFTTSNSLLNNVSNVIIAFDNSSINGSLSIEDSGKSIVFTPSSDSLWEKNSIITGKISRIIESDGGTIDEYAFSFKTGYYAGKGTAEKPYLVSNAEDLNNLRIINEENNYRYFKQTQDIDLSSYGTSYDGGKGWMPIPTDNNTDTNSIEDTWFGFYDGDNHTIKNLYANRANKTVGLFNNLSGNIENTGIEISKKGTKDTYCGLYGRTGAGLAKKVTCLNQSIVSNCWVGGTGKINCSLDCAGLFVTIDGSIKNSHSTIEVESNSISSSCVAGLVSYISNNVENCYSSGTIQNGIYTGGLVGKIVNANIINSYSNVSIIGAKYVGGLIGYSENSNINNCNSLGQVSYSNSNNIGSFNYDYYTGGLVGYTTNNSSIKNSYSSCEVTSGAYAGGLIGYLGDNSNISNCYALGNVIAGTSGGLLGCALNSGNISNCFAKGQVYGVSGSIRGGLIGTIENSGYVKNCYSTGYVGIDKNQTSISASQGGGLIGKAINTSGIINCYETGYYYSTGYCSGLVGWIGKSNIRNCYSGASTLSSSQSDKVYRIAYIVSETTISNSYARKDMYIITHDTYGHSSSNKPGMINPLPSTVALDDINGANLPDNPDWKNEIFKDGYDEGTSFDDIWQIGSSGFPKLKNMPGNPVQ